MSDYERGEAVIVRGKRVADMTREELIAFIGELDGFVEMLKERAA